MLPQFQQTSLKFVVIWIEILLTLYSNE